MAGDDLSGQVEQLKAEVRRLGHEVQRTQRLLATFAVLAAIVLGAVFFVFDYRRHGGSTWPWWEKGGALVAALFGGALAVAILFAIAEAIGSLREGQLESARLRTNSQRIWEMQQRGEGRERRGHVAPQVATRRRLTADRRNP